MGCNQAKEPTEVDMQRRRLSVGAVDVAAVGEGADDAGSEDDRGLIGQLGEQQVLDLAGEVNGRKMSIGSETDGGKAPFKNKKVVEQGDKFDAAAEGLGYTCRKGLKPESPNQDSWTILKLLVRSIYAVFDGHGQLGHHVSNFVKEALPKLILKDQRFEDYDAMPEMLKSCFKKAQSLVATADRMKKVNSQMSGTTATLCIHEHGESITLAHVGDSTAVLAHSRKDQKPSVLTRDHKPNLMDEKDRIEMAGGRVVFDGYRNHRVYAMHARYPGLNMSRCFGDLMGHTESGLSAEPEIYQKKLDSNDSFLLLCSDGVWEFCSPEEAVELVLQTGGVQQAMRAAEGLAKEAWERWIQEEGGAVVDDITVLLVDLQKEKWAEDL